MTDTQWCDISEFQRIVDDTYPYRWLSFRSNDGTYRDPHFAKNLAWCEKRADSGKLDGFIVYAVYRPDGGKWAQTLIDMVGVPHPLMAVMIDVESWNGQIKGDHSADINAGRERLARWLGSASRVIGYGNASDLNALWTHRGNVQIVLANYSSNPSFPGKIAHQYTSQAIVAPFGHPVDLNSADGFTSAALQRALGLAVPAPASLPTPSPVSSPIGGKMSAEIKTLTFNLGAPVDSTPRYMLWGDKGYVTIATGPCDILGGSLYLAIDTVTPGEPDAAYQAQFVVDTVDSTGRVVVKSQSLGGDEFPRTSGRTMHQSPAPSVHLNAGQRLRVKLFASNDLQGKTAVAIFRGTVQS